MFLVTFQAPKTSNVRMSSIWLKTSWTNPDIQVFVLIDPDGFGTKTALMPTLESFSAPYPCLLLCAVFIITHLYYSTLLGPQVKADSNLILRFAQSSDCRWVGHLSLGSRSVDNVGSQLITWWWWWWWWW